MCKKFVQAKKQMQIYKVPTILLLCLKRFKRSKYHLEKYNMYQHDELDSWISLLRHSISPSTCSIMTYLERTNPAMGNTSHCSTI